MRLKVPISGASAISGLLVAGSRCGLEGGVRLSYGNFYTKSSHMIIPQYWNPQQVERLLDSLAALEHRRVRVAALIMWRSGLRVGETVALEWRT